MTVDKPRGSRPFGDKQHSTGPSTGQHHHGHAHGQQIGGFNRGGHQAQHGQHGHDHRQNWRDGQRSNNNPTYQNQKPNASRKINVYSPYLSEKEAKKGLETGQFLKGVFRVNPRNYEECYVSNPDGGDELDILIYGNVARNRAFQGDVVVLRIRDRANWAVNEALYKNWLASGELDSVNQSGDTANPNVSPVNVSDELAYDRNKMYSIRAQVVKRKDSCPSLLAYTDELVLKEVPETPPVELQPPPKVQQQQQRSNEKKNQRKVYKLLDEMPNKGEGIPDSCLQKTAEVVYILEKKLRIAMGHMRPMEKNTNTQFALFSPVDSKIPRMLIPLEQLPKEFATRPQASLTSLY
ncbi:hypothetical protein WR25_26705 [Diploscapter pachys]|uniref:CSD2 domain-containing protein n=1 Tax=Diploscapter pachys TaxID=2018661 RepID=A0A2A2L8Y2_9BILA|nr:hypothetical protein WR25_26705 [Diploscapter pachys]